jgi:GST-like protein
MIDLYYWPTPNGWKVTLMLEETGLPYTVKPVNIGRGEQFAPEFLAISPNNRMPALVDHAPADGGAPLAMFESGAILQYLGNKTGQFYPQDVRARAEVDSWLMWQMGGLGPMMGQANHFALYAKEKIPYAITRYMDEVARLFGVMERRLADRDYLAGSYSIADMAAWSWAVAYERLGLDGAPYPRVRAWIDRVGAREAVQRGRAVGADLWNSKTTVLDDEARKALFGQR